MALILAIQTVGIPLSGLYATKKGPARAGQEGVKSLKRQRGGVGATPPAMVSLR